MQVGIRGADCVVLGVEKKSVLKLQDPRTVRKIAQLDDHVCMAFAGLTADARVLINKARIECQSHRLTVEDPVSVEYITRYIAGVQQANAIGRSSKTVREFLEKNYKESMSDDDSIKLAVRALLEIVQTGAKNIEIAVMGPSRRLKTLDASEVDAVVAVIEQENAAEAAAKAGGSSSALAK
ncbi:Proteasome subunit alpha type-4 [Cladochytrium tenue]|nr:Proteasome subunit alpha type-4 [Cladochytrium tenue]